MRCDKVYLAKATSRTLTIYEKHSNELLPKLLEISKTSYIIYRPDTCNLHTKIVLYQDQEKLLKQVDGR